MWGTRVSVKHLSRTTPTAPQKRSRPANRTDHTGYHGALNPQRGQPPKQEGLLLLQKEGAENKKRYSSRQIVPYNFLAFG